MRIAVIGSGIVGSCVAWNLTQMGAEVLMFDSGRPGSGVTNWSFSWINASNKTQTREYFDLNVAGMSAYRDLAADFNDPQWCHLTGHLRWFDTVDGSEKLLANVTLLKSWGYGALWTADQVHRLLEPEVVFPQEDMPVGVYLDEGWIGGQALASLLAEEAIGRGARASFDAPVTDIVFDGGRVSAVVSRGVDHVKVDAVVNSSGPAAGQIASLVGRKLPMRDEPGLVVRLLCDDVPVRRAMHTPHVEIRPDGGNQVLLHSREVDAKIGGASSEQALAAELLALGVGVVPALERAEVVTHKVAWRPIPDDGFP